jgi:hypothetical protein
VRAALLDPEVEGIAILGTSVYRHPATRRHIPDDLSATEKSRLLVG